MIYNLGLFLCGVMLFTGSLCIRFIPSLPNDIDRYNEAIGIEILTAKIYMVTYIFLPVAVFSVLLGSVGIYGMLKYKQVRTRIKGSWLFGLFCHKH